MKYIINIRNIIRNLLPKHTNMPLGRWRYETCPKKMNQKIDLSNEDHCGPCGQYALNKIDLKKNSSKTTTNASSFTNKKNNLI